MTGVLASTPISNHTFLLIRPSILPSSIPEKWGLQQQSSTANGAANCSLAVI